MDIAGCPEEQIFNCNQPDIDDCVGCENQDEDAVAMIEESPSGMRVTFESSCFVYLTLCSTRHQLLQ